MSDPKYTHILFDAGGTLLGTNTDSEFWYEQFFVDACAEQGCIVTVHEVHDVLRRAAHSRKFESRCSSDAQAREFWHHIYTTSFAELLGAKSIKNTPAFINHLSTDYIDRFEAGEFVRLFPDVKDTLIKLKGRGFKMGIVSNFSTYLRDFLKQLDIDQYFDFAVISAEEGCEKPGNEIFDRAMRRCNLTTPTQVVFVGDSLKEDYIPAQNHGMRAVLIDRHNRHDDKPDLVRIQSLTALSAIL